MIDYNKFITDAYMSVVKNALMVAATDPDPNNIHFYITLETTISGVMIPDWIRADYPNVITIVLNQQYENMVVGHDYFSVTLYFKGKPAPLVFPFKSIIEFTDVIHNFRVGFPPGLLHYLSYEKPHQFCLHDSLLLCFRTSGFN